MIKNKKFIFYLIDFVWATFLDWLSLENKKQHTELGTGNYSKPKFNIVLPAILYTEVIFYIYLN